MKPYQLYMNKQKEVEKLDKEIQLKQLELDGLQMQRQEKVDERDEEQPGYYFEESDMHVYIDHENGGVCFADGMANPIVNMTCHDAEQLVMHLLNWGALPHIKTMITADDDVLSGQFIVPDFIEPVKKEEL